MPYDVTILGTASMVPTKERNVQSIYMEYRGEGMLIDCGEGTQRQMNICGINRNKVRKILVSHWHGDHVAGIIGMLQTVGHQLGQQQDEYAEEKKEKAQLEIYGPKGTKTHMHHLMQATIAEQGKINIKIHELPMESHKFYETEYFELWCAPLMHGTPVLGYALIEKDRRKMDMELAGKLGLSSGRKIGLLQKGETVKHNDREIKPEMVSTVVHGKKFVVIADTKPCNEAIRLAENADVLVIESTFSAEHEDKARKFKHLTAEQAAGIAQQAGAKKLILTHFSQRYKDLNPLLDQASVLHPDVKLAYDFMRIEL